MLATSAHAVAQAPAEPTLRVDLLDNGSGAEIGDAPEGEERRMLLPWWTSSGSPRSAAPTGAAVEVAPGTALSQPIAAYAPLAHTLIVSGRVKGAAHVALVDGRGTSSGIDARDQEFTLAARAPDASSAPLPRFTLELSSPAGSGGASFSSLHAYLELPCPTDAALATELRELCDGVIKTWLERGIDRDGARKTAFLTTRFDAVTGEIDPRRSPNSVNPFYEALLDATSVVDDARWRAGLDAYLNDFFELCFHPATGLPRDWDGELDLPQDAKPIQIARCLGFLLDLAERGPESFRARALERARAIGETVLARGRLPDGTLAVQYVPATAAPDLGTPPIRQLDVAAQLARLSKKTGDERLALAARTALAELDYLHFWGGTWNAIDPDFDDTYGNYGAKATTMLAAFPDDPVFRRFTERGVRHFAPLWRDALRFGGSIAADQTRCWEFLQRYAELVPASRAEIEPLLRAAVRAHFKGEQYDNGAWGDMTFAGFSTKTLNVGDFSGTPGNLLKGLAWMYRPGSALRTDETRAMFTAVLRSSKASYAREFGWLSSRQQAQGRNPAGAEIHLLIAAAEMLRNLR